MYNKIQKSLIFLLLPALLLFLSLFIKSGQKVEAQTTTLNETVVYDDTFKNNFAANLDTATTLITTTRSDLKASGSYSMELNLFAYRTPYFYSTSGSLNSVNYTDLEFDTYFLNGPSGPVPHLYVSLANSSYGSSWNTVIGAGSGGYVSIVPNGGWKHVKIPLSAFNIPTNTLFAGLTINDREPWPGNDSSADLWGHVLVDNIKFTKYGVASPTANPTQTPTPTNSPLTPTLTPSFQFDADISQDGKVDSSDVLILFNNWITPTNLRADINKDGVVNSVDYGILVGKWSAPTSTATPPTPTSPSTSGLPWLKTSGNRILTVGGNSITLRGANVIRDEWASGSMTFVRAAIPEIAKNWKGNFVTHGFASGPVNSGDAGYLARLDEYVSLAEANKIYINLAYYYPTENGTQPNMPDDAAQQALAKLAARYKNKSNVMYQVQVEPSGVTWAQLLPRFNSMVTAIRQASYPNKPLILIPGTNWARDTHWAITNPVTADSGINIVYTSHPYDPSSYFQQYFIDTYNANLPVIITEFGSGTMMSMTDVNTLLSVTRQRNIGWTAWVFDSDGPPVLLKDRTTMTPTDPYGVAVKNEMLTTPIIPSN